MRIERKGGGACNRGKLKCGSEGLVGIGGCGSVRALRAIRLIVLRDLIGEALEGKIAKDRGAVWFHDFPGGVERHERVVQFDK